MRQGKEWKLGLQVTPRGRTSHVARQGSRAGLPLGLLRPRALYKKASTPRSRPSGTSPLPGSLRGFRIRLCWSLVLPCLCNAPRAWHQDDKACMTWPLQLILRGEVCLGRSAQEFELSAEGKRKLLKVQARPRISQGSGSGCGNPGLWMPAS